MNSNNRTAATLYSVGTQFVSGLKVQIPCIKEMMMMMMIMMIIIIIIINKEHLFDRHSCPKYT
jgi:hypothetical protein